eukprot:COSAG01_NODE_72338_length_253_cov_0.675325_1_plen_22_part_01
MAAGAQQQPQRREQILISVPGL